MAKPLISIIIPAYNRADLIVETLDSVSKQSFQDWECLVVDDGSEDDTVHVVQQFMENDKRFRFFKRPDEFKNGGSGAKNYGIQQSEGKYLMFLDSDDLYDVNFVEEQVKKISGEPETTICFSKYYTFRQDVSDAKKENPRFFRDFPDVNDYVKYYCLNGYAFYTACLIAAKTLVEKAGGWNEDLTINDDGEFLINVALTAKKILFTENATVYYRVNPSGKMLYEYPEKADHILDSLKLISNHIMSRADFENKPAYCATLFVHLKFLYPDNKEVWQKADQEIEHLGGKHFYIHDDALFNSIWKVFGLSSAFLYRRIRNYSRKHLKTA